MKRQGRTSAERQGPHERAARRLRREGGAARRGDPGWGRRPVSPPPLAAAFSLLDGVSPSCGSRDLAASRWPRRARPRRFWASPPASRASRGLEPPPKSRARMRSARPLGPRPAGTAPTRGSRPVGDAESTCPPAPLSPARQSSRAESSDARVSLLPTWCSHGLLLRAARSPGRDCAGSVPAVVSGPR